MNKTRNLLISVLVIMILATFSAIPLALTQNAGDRRGLTGGHAVLTCDMCHADEVWHTTNKDLTICQTCHSNTWNTIMNSKHTALLYEGEFQGSGGDIKAKYCATCHNPHQPDMLRLSFVNGTNIYIPFSEYTNLCVNCHLL